MMEEERNFELEPYTILCFGDSNTWGCIPRWQDSTDPPHRYPRGVRWTSVLQKQLGDKVNVVEEGLGGRTTLRALPTEEGKEKQGIRYFPPCLQTHRPLDMVILMLGTNDMNLPIQPKEEELGNLMSEMIDVIDHKTKCWRDGKRPQILILGPTELRKGKGRTGLWLKYGEEGLRLSTCFKEAYRKVAEERNCEFLSCADFIEPSEADGIHWTAEGHQKMGVKIAEKVKKMMKETGYEVAL